MTTDSLMKTTTQAFNISTSKFYYHNQKLWSEKLEFKQIIERFDQQNYETRLIPFPLQQGSFPDIMIISTPEMIENFKQYGQSQFMTFDVTYNLVKQIKEYKNENG